MAVHIIIDGLPAGTLLNINVPRQPARGVRCTRQGKRRYSEGVLERVDPMGRQYFWMGAAASDWEEDPRADYAALQAGFVSITPLRLDLTDHRMVESMAREWER